MVESKNMVIIMPTIFWEDLGRLVVLFSFFYSYYTEVLNFRPRDGPAIPVKGGW